MLFKAGSDAVCTRVDGRGGSEGGGVLSVPFCAWSSSTPLYLSRSRLIVYLPLASWGGGRVAHRPYSEVLLLCDKSSSADSYRRAVSYSIGDPENRVLLGPRGPESSFCGSSRLADLVGVGLFGNVLLRARRVDERDISRLRCPVSNTFGGRQGSQTTALHILRAEPPSFYLFIFIGISVVLLS